MSTILPAWPTAQPSSPARAPRLPRLPPVSLVSSMNAPSRIEISRSAVAAIRASWVTMTSVCPADAGCRTAAARPGWPRCRGCRWARPPARPAARWPGPARPRPAAAGPRTARWAGTGPGRPAPPAPAGPPPAAGPLRGETPGQQRGQLDVLRGGELVHQVEGLEHEADRLAPQPGQPPLAHRVDALPGQREFAAGGPVQPAQQVQQRGLPAAARSHHRNRLARGDVQVDLVDRADQPGFPAVFLAQAAGPQHGAPPVSLMIPSGWLQVRSHASSQRRSACSRSTMPSSSSPAAERVRLGHRRPLRVAQPAEQLATLGVHDRDRVRQSSRRGRDQLEMELRQVRPGPADLGEPVGHPLLPGRGQRVHLPVRPVGQPGRLLGGHQPRLLQPGERDVDLPGVHRVAHRAERLAQPGPQLVPVRRFLRQHAPAPLPAARCLSLPGPACIDNGYPIDSGYP